MGSAKNPDDGQSRESDSLLNVLQIGLVVIDSNLRLHRTTHKAKELFSLEEHDVSRRIEVVGPHLPFLHLPDVAARVMKTGESESAEGEYEGVQLQVTVAKAEIGSDDTPLPGTFLVVQQVD